MSSNEEGSRFLTEIQTNVHQLRLQIQNHENVVQQLDRLKDAVKHYKTTREGKRVAEVEEKLNSMQDHWKELNDYLHRELRSFDNTTEKIAAKVASADGDVGIASLNERLEDLVTKMAEIQKLNKDVKGLQKRVATDKVKLLEADEKLNRSESRCKEAEKAVYNMEISNQTDDAIGIFVLPALLIALAFHVETGGTYEKSLRSLVFRANNLAQQVKEKNYKNLVNAVSPNQIENPEEVSAVI